MATPAGARYLALAAMVALLTGAILLLARLLRLGFISDFLSRTVLVGFLTGVGMQVGTVGVEQGIVLAMIVSLLRVVRHVYHPRSGVLVADGSGGWKLAPVTPGMVTEPGLVLYRFGAALFYANAGRFFEEASCLAHPMPSAVRWLVVDAEAITNVDYSAARVVMELKKNLREADVELAFARVPWDLRSDFDRHHLTEAIGPDRIFNRLHDALAAFDALTKPLDRKACQTSADGMQNSRSPLGER